MRSVPTILVHPSQLFAEGLRRILATSAFKLSWMPSLSEPLPARAVNGKRDPLFIIAAQSPVDMEASIATIQRQCAEARVVVVGDHKGEQVVVAALRAGADGYLQEAMSCEALVKALELVVQGETVVPSNFLRSMTLVAASEAAAPAVQTTAPAAAVRPVQPAVADNAVEDCAAPALVDSVRSAPRETCESAELPRVMATATRPDPTTRARPPAPKDGALSAREAEILRCLVRGASNKEIARNLGMAEATVKVHLKAILRKIHVKNRTQAAIWAVNHVMEVGGGGEDEQLPRVKNGLSVQRNGRIN